VCKSSLPNKRWRSKLGGAKWSCFGIVNAAERETMIPLMLVEALRSRAMIASALREDHDLCDAVGLGMAVLEEAAQMTSVAQ
jgi:hypothetical protein